MPHLHHTTECDWRKTYIMLNGLFLNFEQILKYALNTVVT